MLFNFVAACLSTITLHEIDDTSNRVYRCERNKTLHLIRHAEGWHNIDELMAERDELHKTHPQGHLRAEFGIAWILLKQVSGEKYHDPLLTPKGREQAYALRSRLRAETDFIVDAVALSPMRRTIETALLALPQLEAAVTSVRLNDPRSNDSPTTLPAPALLATDLLRERCAHFQPDSRLLRSELEREYSGLNSNVTIDFSAISEEDKLFHDGQERWEPEVGSALLASRAMKALRWLADLPREYARIAVVSHKHFLGALVSTSLMGAAQRPFENCEKRTVLLCDERPPLPRDAALDAQSEMIGASKLSDSKLQGQGNLKDEP